MSEGLIVIMLPVVLIVLDVLSGYIAAMKRGELNSSMMLEGLWNKTGELLAIALSKVCEFCISIYGDSFLDMQVDAPLCIVVCGLVSLYELTSVAENIGKINPDFGVWLIKKLGVAPYKVGLQEVKEVVTDNSNNSSDSAGSASDADSNSDSDRG